MTFDSCARGISAPSESLHMTGAGFWQDRINDNNILSLVPIIIRDAESICGLRAVFGTDNVIVASQILYNLVIRGLTLSDAIENPRYFIFPLNSLLFNHKNLYSQDIIYSPMGLPLKAMKDIPWIQNYVIN